MTMIAPRPATLFALASTTVAALTFAPGFAHADTADEVLTKTVRFQDLNLDNRSGVESLYRRIENAAGEVCGPDRRTGSPFVSAAWTKCVTTAVQQAVRTVDRPSLTAYYVQHQAHQVVPTLAVRDRREGVERSRRHDGP
jgi:UrcA family protein